MHEKLKPETEKQSTEQKDPIPFYVYEAMVETHERIKRQLITAIIVIAVVLGVALGGTNAYWLYEWSQFDTVAYSQDGEGTNIIGAGNKVRYEPEVSR